MDVVVIALLWLQAPTVDDAMRLATQGRLVEAETMLRGIAARDTKDADVRYRLGLILFKQRKLDDAARYIDEATAREPSAVPVWRAAALVRAARQDGIGEAKAWQKIIELEPTDGPAYRKLAALLLEHRTADGALAVVDAGVKRFPGDAEMLRLRGLALYGLGRKPEAVDSFLAAVDAAPESDVALASLETLIGDAGDRLPAVIATLERFVERKPESPLGHFLLALAGGDRRKEQRLRQALAADATFWPAHFELGRALREGGKAQAAAEEFEATLRQHPAHEGAHFALAALYTEAGEREKAKLHREAHHRLRAQAAEAEQKRSAAAPRIQVTVR